MDTECFGEDVATATDEVTFRNSATGTCVNLSATQCFELDAAVDLSGTKAVKADGTCLTLLPSQCSEDGTAVAFTATKVKKASTSECVDLTDGNCWNVTTEAQEATSTSNFLNSTTGSCIALLATQCFKEDAASDNSSTQARKADGTCAEVTAAQCWDGANDVAKDTSAAAPLVFKKDSDSNCVDVGESECYNDTTEAAAVTNAFQIRDDDNTCEYVLTDTQCFDTIMNTAADLSGTVVRKANSNCLTLAENQCFDATTDMT